MGRVGGDVNSTDAAHWNSLGKEDSTASYRLINAEDSTVLDLANSVEEDLVYSAVPTKEDNYVNSNTAAGTIAHRADGGSTQVKNNALQPGHSLGRRIKMSNTNNHDSGMSGSVVKICTGMGAQKDGCQ
jgi:hypothetical protein